MHFFKFYIFFFVSLNSFSQKNTPENLWKMANKLPSNENTKKLEFYQKAAILAKKQNNFVWEANVMPDICGAYFNMGDYINATKICIEGLQILNEKKIGVDSIAFKLHSSLATCHNKTYRIGESLKEFEIANQILNKNPKVAQQSALFAAYHFSNQAHLLVDLFEIENAKILYEKALQISKTLPSKKHYAVILSNLSQYYLFLGQPEKGIEKLEEAFRISSSKSTLTPSEVSNLYYMLGTFYRLIKDTDLALLNFRKSIKNAKKVGKSYENEYMAQNSMANIYFDKGDYPKSLEILNAIDPKKFENPENLHEYYLIFGDIYLKKNKTDLAISYYEKAFNSCFPNQSIFRIDPKQIYQHKFRLFEILGRLSKAFELKYRNNEDLNDLTKSYAFKKKVILVGKSIRAFQENLDSKLFFTDKYHKNYVEAIKLGYELLLKKPSDQLKIELFNLAEEAKSVSLNDNLLSKNHKRDVKSDSLLAKLNAYQSYISFLRNQTPQDYKGINEYELKSRDILKEIKNSNIAFYSSVFEEKPLSNQKILDGTIYLNYFLVESELFVFSKNHFGIKIQRTIIKPLEFKKNVSELSLTLQNQPHPLEGFNQKAKCEYFYKILFNGLKNELKDANRLIINPENSFYGVSFDILQNPVTKKYLIETHAISYANNLEHAFNGSVDQSNISEKWLSFFPFSSTTQKLISGLKPLKFSLEEVKGIIANVKKDKEASKEIFLETISKANKEVVLMATHASGNESDPFLIFDEGNQMSSRLYASEIRQRKVASPMIILSACETNKGRTLNGLGVLSFAKTLSWAGCPSVVGTFWNVDDKSMSVLASFFYRNLMSGMTKDEALQRAKLSYLQSDIGLKNDVPFYWAHLQIMGNTNPIVTQSMVYYWFSITIVIFLVIGFYFRNTLKKLFLTKAVS